MLGFLSFGFALLSLFADVLVQRGVSWWRMMPVQFVCLGLCLVFVDTFVFPVIRVQAGTDATRLLNSAPRAGRGPISRNTI